MVASNGSEWFLGIHYRRFYNTRRLAYEVLTMTTKIRMLEMCTMGSTLHQCYNCLSTCKTGTACTPDHKDNLITLCPPFHRCVQLLQPICFAMHHLLSCLEEFFHIPCYGPSFMLKSLISLRIILQTLNFGLLVVIVLVP